MKLWSYSVFIYIIGFIAQFLFSFRLIIQWFKSEKSKTVQSPVIFWEMSLLASFLLFTYGLFRNDFSIILGQSITYIIYIRNLQLHGVWSKYNVLLKLIIILFPSTFFVYTISTHPLLILKLFDEKIVSHFLLIWGSIGQFIFTLRFIYQWIYSEKVKESKLPFGFWLLSLIGSFMILSYAVIRKDPVLFLGQSFGFFVYIRNLFIGIKENR